MSMCWKKGKKTGPWGIAMFTHRQIKKCCFGVCFLLSNKVFV